MKIFFKFFSLVVLTILVLSVEIKNKPIFSHIYKSISPMTKATQRTIEKFLNQSMDTTKKYSHRIFDNSIPKIKDSVSSKSAGLKRNVTEPGERISEKDREELDELIKTHQ